MRLHIRNQLQGRNT